MYHLLWREKPKKRQNGQNGAIFRDHVLINPVRYNSSFSLPFMSFPFFHMHFLLFCLRFLSRRFYHPCFLLLLFPFPSFSLGKKILAVKRVPTLTLTSNSQYISFCHPVAFFQIFNLSNRHKINISKLATITLFPFLTPVLYYHRFCMIKNSGLQGHVTGLPNAYTYFN